MTKVSHRVSGTSLDVDSMYITLEPGQPAVHQLNVGLVPEIPTTSFIEVVLRIFDSARCPFEPSGGTLTIPT